MYDICFKNNYVTLAWDLENRLVVLDSDGVYIDYVTQVSGKELRNSASKKYMQEFEDKNEYETCARLRKYTRILKVEPYCGDKKTIKYLRDEWGDEWVVRIGNTALVLAE